MDCRVVVEAAVPVYDVETADEAVRIAISKTGEMLNPDLNYVEIDMGERSCPHCGEEMETAFIAADESLVALELEMTVFSVERDEHAARIARKEIGQRLENIPLTVLEIEEIESEDEDEDEETEADVADDAEDEETEENEADDVEDASTDEADEEGEPDPAEELASLSAPSEGTAEGEESTGEDDEDVLPEFEELIED